MHLPICRDRVPFACLVALATVLLAVDAEAQYFGRNKVQYEKFDFHVMDTEHYDIHFYPAESLATKDAARMAERWYTRLSNTLQHEYAGKPLIFYADHADFQQTNVIGGFIEQGTGGITEALRTRVVMPFTGVYADFDHVLGHELVHTFQYDIAYQRQAGGLRGLSELPLWVVEGMAEYLSVGREDPHTAMWLRDAVRRNDLPRIEQIGRDARYFPYRYGQAVWAYIAGRFGDAAVPQLFRDAIRRGFQPAIARTLGMTMDTLSARWHTAVREAYLPALQGRTSPDSIGRRVLERAGSEGELDISPALSPDGRHVAFFSGRALFTIDLYVADANTGDIVRRLSSPNVDPHFDALSFLSSTGTWSPDGRRLAFVVFSEGDQELAIFDLDRRELERRIKIRGVDALSDPSWGPNDQIAFSGMQGGISDLYVLDLASEQVVRLTNDRHADLQPAWSPDGNTLAFTTDRGPATDFTRLTYSKMTLATLDLNSRQVRTHPVFEGAKHINPQFSPDGTSLYFISDREGFSDIYRLAIADGAVYQVTRLATGVSGITALAPALSVARSTGTLMFAVFDRGGYTLRRMEPDEAMGQPVAAGDGRLEVAGLLPPFQPQSRSVVTAYLADPLAGLPSQTEFPVARYDPGLSLEYLGSPTAGVAVSSSGGAAAGGAIAGYFSDLLVDRVVGGTFAGGGSFKDIGGELFYINQRGRWNLGASVSHEPFLTGASRVRDTSFTIGGSQVPGVIVEQLLQRLYLQRAAGFAQYPFSQTRRLEGSLGFTRVGYDFDLDRFAVIGNQIVDQTSEDVNAPPGLNLIEGAVALVGDYSFFGFTSPIAGGRYRFELAPTTGSLTYGTVLADYRRYLFLQPVTLAVRGIHYGRYGGDAEDPNLTPIFLGREHLIRGYAVESFDPGECTSVPGTNQCPEFDRLIGSRIGVVNLELRIPLFGTPELGLLETRFLPVEIAPFLDAGAAWTRSDGPKLEFSRKSLERVPVVSAGVSTRLNLFGYAVIEIYYAHPFQRPEKGWHFGFNLAPGW
ncbi:MAG TPA: BamA/TamA family outer membrane protein [Gemmatimonadaceae bacterium]|nr:BamA/TamA family outer membrane protein [Gemmatimonadaceae bacterium]